MEAKEAKQVIKTTFNVKGCYMVGLLNTLYAVVQQHECTKNVNTNSVTSTCSHGPVFRYETSAFKIAIFAGGFKLTHTLESV